MNHSALFQGFLFAAWCIILAIPTSVVGFLRLHVRGWQVIIEHPDSWAKSLVDQGAVPGQHGDAPKMASPQILARETLEVLMQKYGR